jgi:hypothetical protein
MLPAGEAVDKAFGKAFDGGAAAGGAVHFVDVAAYEFGDGDARLL